MWTRHGLARGQMLDNERAATMGARVLNRVHLASFAAPRAKWPRAGGAFWVS
jgi:hypothetical protein